MHDPIIIGAIYLNFLTLISIYFTVGAMVCDRWVMKTKNFKGWRLVFGLILSFFIFAHYVSATHAASVSITPRYVEGGATDMYVFEITNDGPDSIYKIVIKAETEFTIHGDLTCPSGWFASYTDTTTQCLTDPDTSNVLTSGNSAEISFSATAPDPDSDTQYLWTTLTKSFGDDFHESTNTDAKTTIDVTMPTTEDDAPAGWQNFDVTVTLTCDDGELGSGCKETHYQICDENGEDCGADETGNAVSITCSDGLVCKKTIRYHSVDKISNEEIDKITGVIQIDKQAPSTTDYATEGWKASDVTVTLTPDDGEGSGVTSTMYCIDTEGICTPGTLGTSGSVICPGGEVCERYVRYYSTDKVGNDESVETSVLVQIDKSDPEIGAINIEPSYFDGEVNYILGISDISASVTDTGSGIKQCRYTLDGGTNWIGTGIAYESAGSTCSILWVDTSGAGMIDINAEDNVGNSGAGVAVLVAPDTTAPSVSVGGVLANWQNIDATATVECDDMGGSGCNTSTYAYKLYDLDPTSCPTSKSYYTIGDSVTISSHQWVCAYARDTISNSGISSPTEFKVDKVPPTITDNYDYEGTWVNSEQTVTLTPNDAGGSEIKEVKYCEGYACDPVSGTVSTSPYWLSYTTDQDTIVRYQTWDDADNPSTLGEYNVKLDKSGPIARVDGAPANWQNSDATATVTCSDQEELSECDENSYKLHVSTIEIASCPDAVDSYDKTSSQTISKHSWVCSYVKDVVGNDDVSDFPTEFKVDKTTPTGSLIGVPETWQDSDATIELTCSDEGGSDCNSDEDYSTIVPYGQSCDPATHYTNPIIVSQHSTACWKVIDNAGNSAKGSSEIKIDKDTPESSITTSVDNSKINSLTEISGITSDTGGSGVSKVEISIQRTSDNHYFNGGFWRETQSWLTTTGTTSWSYAYTPDADGTYVVVSRATDAAGNVEISGDEQTNTFLYDTKKPVTALTPDPATPDGLNGWYTTEPSITFSCDGGNGSECYETYLGVDTEPLLTGLVSCCMDSTCVRTSRENCEWGGGTIAEGSTSCYPNPCEGDAAIFKVRDGIYTLYYFSTDMGGNQEDTKSQEFKVDAIAPNITTYTLQVEGKPATTANNVIFSPNEDGVRDAVTIDLEFPGSVSVDLNIKDSDNNINIVKDVYNLPYAKNPEPKTWDGKDNSENIISDGIYTIELIINDQAGNSIADTSKTITVDTESPSFTLASPTQDTVYTSASIGLTFTPTDPTPGTALTCSYKVDDGTKIDVIVINPKIGTS